ncbi:Hypothetical predicted protein [Mytilus galloprovincialis]|uniref:Uncharacterized protein n=1 Tax=Mytilus galloprovincialis TaxID=29158 RepID=A0A8B6GE87_MYTGA|nr:Hypothetical predicted protein [Mytilus galloprovincialis]
MTIDGETALFKAVKHSNIESVVALVAFNATINVVNNKGQSPLDIAVAKKDAAVVELLCSLGSSVTIDDWTVGGVDVNILSKEDQNIMRILINQLEREAENSYGYYLTRIKTATFVVLSQLRQEEFDVTQEAVKIIPQSESSAEINIPDGAFKSPGKLMLNVANTNDWNSEETVLFTNVIDLTMQTKIQPAKPVNVKLPLHSLTVSVDDLIIIASHKDIPETEKDWEICPTNVKIEGNMISFSAEHFTWFAVGSKKNFQNSAESATLAVLQYRPTEIFAGLKKETDNKLTLIVEIALKHFGKRRRKYLRQKGFRLQTIEYRDEVFQDGEKLKISLEGNFQIDTIGSSKEHIIFNHNKKRNYRTFYIVSEQQEPPIGDVVVVRTTKKIVEQTVIDKLENKIKPGLWSVLCNNVVKVATSTSRKVAIENGIEELVRLPIDGQLFDENQDVRVNIDDSQCTIPVLRKSSLFRLGQQ